MYKEVEGNLIEMALKGDFDAIVHGCNCHNKMGAGIALQIAQRFPQVYENDTDFHKLMGEINSLGNLIVTPVREGDTEFIVVNAYTQQLPGPNLDYTALTLCLRKLNQIAKGKKIGLPQIGCGIAGGDWVTVQTLIQQELKDCDVTVVIYKP